MPLCGWIVEWLFSAVSFHSNVILGSIKSSLSLWCSIYWYVFIYVALQTTTIDMCVPVTVIVSLKSLCNAKNNLSAVVRAIQWANMSNIKIRIKDCCCIQKEIKRKGDRWTKSNKWISDNYLNRYRYCYGLLQCGREQNAELERAEGAAQNDKFNIRTHACHVFSNELVERQYSLSSISP